MIDNKQLLLKDLGAVAIPRMLEASEEAVAQITEEVPLINQLVDEAASYGDNSGNSTEYATALTLLELIARLSPNPRFTKDLDLGAIDVELLAKAELCVDGGGSKELKKYCVDIASKFTPITASWGDNYTRGIAVAYELLVQLILGEDSSDKKAEEEPIQEPPKLSLVNKNKTKEAAAPKQTDTTIPPLLETCVKVAGSDLDSLVISPEDDTYVISISLKRTGEAAQGKLLDISSLTNIKKLKKFEALKARPDVFFVGIDAEDLAKGQTTFHILANVN